MAVRYKNVDFKEEILLQSILKQKWIAKKKPIHPNFVRASAFFANQFLFGIDKKFIFFSSGNYLVNKMTAVPNLLINSERLSFFLSSQSVLSSRGKVQIGQFFIDRNYARSKLVAF